jgi:membrane-bound serine protease (ClpP class)
VASIACLVLGSTFIFRSDIWFIPAVNPILALIVSLLSAGFFWIATKKVMEARAIQPTHDLQALIGATGTAKTNIQADGSVQVAGELWTARSKTPIPRGAHVRVIGRDGFVLEVESIKKGSS